MSDEHNKALGESEIFVLSRDEEIMGIGMTLVGAGRPDSPVHHWRENLSTEQRQDALGTFRTLFQIRSEP